MLPSFSPLGVLAIALGVVNLAFLESKLAEGHYQLTDSPLHKFKVFVTTVDRDIIVTPCEDFHAFVCKRHKYGYQRNLFKSPVAEAQDNIITKLKGVLEEEGQNVFPDNIIRTFYESCMNTEEIDAKGIEPIQSVMNRLNGWPIIKQYSKNDKIANLQRLLIFYGKINVFPLFKISVNSDVLKGSPKIWLRQPKTIIRQPLLYKAKGFNKYVDYIKTVALSINVNESNVSEHEIIARVKQIVCFEAEISKILDMSDKSDFHRTITLKKFQSITSQMGEDLNNELDWIQILSGIFLTTSRLVTIDDSIDVSSLTYFPKLAQLLHRTPTRTIVSYIHWRFVHQFLLHTSNKFRNLYFDMKPLMQDAFKNESRWRFCGFEPAFDHAMSHLFEKKYMRDTDKHAQRVLSDIKHAMLQTIKTSSLLNVDEKETAEQKISNMNFILGIPEPLKNISVLNDYYKELIISTNYFHNVLSLRKFYKMKELQDIGRNNYKSPENNNFMKITTVSSIGSAYDFFENRVLIKAENLVEPLFSPDYPEFKKYGTLGFIIAYEIMHAFNDADTIENRNAKKHMYSEETKLKYWDKLECFINQFDNYYITNPLDTARHVYVDGERSAMENVADSAAIQIAFEAYYKRSRKQKIVSIQDDENFFISFANLLCRPELEEFYLSRFNLALRTLPQFRIIGSLSNTNEFAKTFSCLNGDRMNPERKCNFWN